MKTEVTLKVNGDSYNLYVEPKRTLLEILREELRLTGTKEACGQGACGACTVLLNNRPILSCITLAVGCEGMDITTIEGLNNNQELHPLQKAFIDKGAVQCGMCTPGMILSAKALLDVNQNATEMEVKEAISGNLCRCTGYKKITEAILSIACSEDKSAK